MMKNLLVTSLATAAFLGQAHAVIVSGTVNGGSAAAAGGVFIELTTPFTPPNGTLNTIGGDDFNLPNLYGFNENQNIVSSSMIEVDIGTNVAAGQVVASHYIFFDPGPNQSIEGCVTFDADVFGIVTSTGLLQASDFLQANGITYENPSLRGLENIDSVSIDPNDSKTICLDFVAQSPGDFIRVLTAESPTAAIPLPAAGWLFGTALAGFAFRRSRQGA